MISILFYKHQDDPAPWLADLARQLPQARIRMWHPGDADPADYALVWKPPLELLQRRQGLKAVFNLGAGVDVLLGFLREHPFLLPPHVSLIKLDDAGMAAQMNHYVGHAVLRHFRQMDAYGQLKQEMRWHVLPPKIQADYPIGVMGLGALGMQVASYLAAMGFPVRGWSRSGKHLAGVQCYSGEETLPVFLDGLQVLVNMMPLTAQTENMLDRTVFNCLARGAHLINVARGAQVVDDDLLAALSSGQLGGATLDAFRTEPLPSGHPFWREPRIAITPHIAALTERTESIRQIASKIEALEKGESVGGIVDLARGY